MISVLRAQPGSVVLDHRKQFAKSMAADLPPWPDYFAAEVET
jgi:hypothetical protein